MLDIICHIFSTEIATITLRYCTSTYLFCDNTFAIARVKRDVLLIRCALLKYKETPSISIYAIVSGLIRANSPWVRGPGIKCGPSAIRKQPTSAPARINSNNHAQSIFSSKSINRDRYNVRFASQPHY